MPFIGLNQTNLNEASPLFSVYPNPVDQMLYVDITLSNQQSGFLSLHNVTGQLLQSTSLNSAQIHRQLFDLRDYAAGMYFVQLHTDGRIFSQKIIKK